MLDGIAVGYNTDSLVYNKYRMFGPSFQSIGNETGMKIKDIQWGAVESGDTMYLIDKVTLKQTELTYLTADAASEYELKDGAGWYDVSEEPFVFKGNEVADRGFGFWIFPGIDGSDLTFSGEVKNTFTRTFPYNRYGAFANPFPTKMALKKFSWNAEESGDTLYLIDKTTAKQTELTYLTADAASEYELQDGAGWYDVSEEPFVFKGNEELDPGQGCWIFPGIATATLTGSLDL